MFSEIIYEYVFINQELLRKGSNIKCLSKCLIDFFSSLIPYRFRAFYGDQLK